MYMIIVCVYSHGQLARKHKTHTKINNYKKNISFLYVLKHQHLWYSFQETYIRKLRYSPYLPFKKKCTSAIYLHSFSPFFKKHISLYFLEIKQTSKGCMFNVQGNFETDLRLPRLMHPEPYLTSAAT